MQEPTNESTTERKTKYSTDQLFDLLGEERRRVVLFHLRQHGAATTDELVDVLSELVTDPDQTTKAQLRACLYHNHLPKLAAFDLVQIDEAEDVVQYGDVPDDVGKWLDLAIRRDVQIEPAAENDGSPETITVLVVDDHPGMTETIAGWLETETDEITPSTATSVMEAVSVVESEPVDCIVSDYQMPALSGLDFLKAIRERAPDVPFIILTAKGSEEVATEALRADATDYLQKQSDIDNYDELIERIRNAVQDRDTK